MGQYIAPTRDMHFVLHELLHVEEELKQLPKYADIDTNIINQILEEGEKFTAQVLFPLNHSGDREGCHYNKEDQTVTTPNGFKEAYKKYIAAGWPSLSCDPEFGGQGLPMVVNNSFYEMLNSSNLAWSMYPGLSHGAYECIREHGTPELKSLYLPKLVSGEWTGTMCLTESHCGTDLGLLRSKAEPQADGSYHITGSKIFISAGEHDMSQNIVHLVLARLPDAPQGSKGISLFITPKYLPDPDGTLGARNLITCGAIEEKMGIHGNATCQINLDGAKSWLIGSPHKGLQAMFVFMNAARLGVGMQGLGINEIAYQNAVEYAKDRIQSRSLSGIKAPDEAADPIIVHPDVRRMLLTARAYAEGARAFCSYMALQLDKEFNHPDEEVREECADQVALLTPVVKAFITDNAWIATSECLQVFGGHGYIAEWGIEQYVRDARIGMIYEGTNTVQSLDLLGRKILMNNGAKLRKFGEQIQAFLEVNGTDDSMNEFITPLADLAGKVTKLTMEIGMKAFKNRDEVGAAAVPYLRIIGHLVFAYFFARMAKIALAKQDSTDTFYTAKLATIRFYFARLLPETEMLLRQARSGSANLMSLNAKLF
ncbi:MAG: acyl-CoA dehydrogenase, N-terminal domain protein [Solimicrobium sp.]|jgi:butyryl-CoA dehydrogenase|nr:acyl-CoA dehydrogenase, N-terminal domain protein [Solimicrobium sp.]